MVAEKEVMRIADKTAKELGYSLFSWGEDIDDQLSKFRRYSCATNTDLDCRVYYGRPPYRHRASVDLRSMKIIAKIVSPTLGGDVGKNIESFLANRYHVAELWEGSPTMKHTNNYHVFTYLDKIDHDVDKSEIIPKAIRATVYFMEDYEAIVKSIMKNLTSHIPNPRPITK